MEKFRKLTGNQLKIIAVITMIIDHIAYGLIEEGLWQPANYIPYYMGLSNDTWHIIYLVMRSVGRTAFIIYAYFLVDGYFRTRDWKRYALRLGLLAIVSEIPFDLLGDLQWFYWDSQNVFFTLLIGFCMLRLLDAIQEKENLKNKEALQIICVATASWLATFIRADYFYVGIILFAIFYYMRKKPETMYLCGCVWMCLDMASVHFAYVIGCAVGFLILSLYCSERGKNPGNVGKWAFYFAYPIHLLALCIIRGFMF